MMATSSSGSQQDDLLKGLLPKSAQSRLHGSSDFPVIDEYERSRLLRIGGRYCGYVQEQVNRVFDDLRGKQCHIFTYGGISQDFKIRVSL
jgi:hypothetical protein